MSAICESMHKIPHTKLFQKNLFDEDNLKTKINNDKVWLNKKIMLNNNKILLWKYINEYWITYYC